MRRKPSIYMSKSSMATTPSMDANIRIMMRSHTDDVAGFRAILQLNQDSCFKHFILLGVIFSYFCVVIDYTKAEGYGEDANRMYPIHRSLLREVIYCLDFVYFVDLYLAVCNKRAGSKDRNVILLSIDVIAFIPYELIYMVLGGEDVKLYYGFRLRYLVRFLRYLPQFRDYKVQKFSVLTTMTRYLVTTAIISISVTCIRLRYMCLNEMNKFMINCKDMNHFDISYSYFLMNGQITNVDQLFTGSNYAYMGTYIAIIQFLIFILLYLVTAKIICTYIENFTDKYEFAILSSLVLWHGKEVKSVKQSEWSYQDEIFIKFLKNYLKVYWHHWNDTSSMHEFYGYAVATMPDVIKTEINLDVSWNMFKHSMLFRNEDVSFLRHVSLLTNYKFFMEGDKIYTRGQFRHELIYIVSGVVCIMASENGETPIISMSGGTCFGESTLFVNKQLVTTIFCKTACEMVVLTLTNFLKVKKVYPETYNRLRNVIMNRFKKASKYDMIGRKMYEMEEVTTKKRNMSMRYIKKTLRMFLGTKNVMNPEGNMLALDNVRQETLYENTVFCADYIPMYVLADELDTSTTIHFLLTGLNFKLHPHSALIKLWDFMLYIAIVLTLIAYPIGATLKSENYSHLYEFFMKFISVYWILDFISMAFIALPGKDCLHLEFNYIFRIKMQSIDFWIDFISSFPVEYIMNVMQGPLEMGTYRMLQINRLLKAYKLIIYFQRKQYFGTVYLLTVTMIKMIFSLTSIVLIGYYVAHIYNYYDHTVLKEEHGDNFLLQISFIFQFYFSSSLMIFEVSRDVNFMPMIFLQYVVFIWKLQVLPQVVASFSLNCITSIEYENIVEDIRRVFTLYKFEPYMRRKLNKYLHMHYDCGKGLYMMKLHTIAEFIGTSLYKTQRTMMFKELFENEPLFKHLPNHIIRDINEIPKFILIPRGEIVVYAGALAKEIYMIVEGKCAYLSSTLQIFRILGVGESFLVLESLTRSNIVHNVIALTDCKLLCIPSDHLYRKFTRYPDEYDIIQNVLRATVDADFLKTIQHKEITLQGEILKEDVLKSFKSFRNYYGEYKKGFGSFPFLRYIFLKFSIRPCGKFWFYWELSRIILAYLTAFIGTIPITVDMRLKSVWFWIIRFFDVMAFADIYLRHHVMCYNKQNIEVRHPWITAINYWRTSFAVDFLGAFPFDFVLFKYVQDKAVIFLVLTRINRYLQLYRLIGFRKYLNELYMSELKGLMILYYVLSVLLLVNFLEQFLIFGHCTCDIYKKEIFCEDAQPFWAAYFLFYKKVMKNFFHMGIYDSRYPIPYVWKFALINLIGMVTITTFSSLITGNSLFRNSHLTTFQIKMQRLVSFMNMRKIDKNLRSEIIKYYEHFWILREGKTLRKTFENFNSTTFEEMMYSHNGAILQNSVLFKGFPRVVIKDFLSSPHMSRDLVLIKGIILKVNDVQDKIFILLKGTVEVLGPDYSKLRTLEVGSIFGCFDRVPLHRATLTYVAKTHCEFLSMNTIVFHDIIQSYHAFYKHYLYLIKTSNFDYVSSEYSTQPREETVEQLVTTPSFRKKKKKKKLRALMRIFRVQKPNGKLKLFFVIYCFFAFLIECYQKITFKDTNVMIVMCFFIDIIFWIKIYLDFSTAFENAYGLLVTKRKLIALRYLKDYGGFAFDLLCNFPFEIIALGFYRQSNVWFVWTLCRGNRLLKIIIVFRFVKSVRNRLNINVHLIRGVYILLLMITLQQLSMIVLKHLMTDIDASDDVLDYIRPLATQTYFMSLSIYVPFGLKEHPRGKDIYYTITYSILMLITRFVTIYVFAECVSSYKVLNYSRFRYESYLRKLSKEITTKDVSSPLVKRVLKYFIKLAGSGRNVQFPSFVREAPYYLREGVLHSMFGFHLRRHPIFKQCHCDLVRQIAATFETAYFFPGDFIAFKDDIDMKMYFIHEGEIDCLSEDNLYYDVVRNKYKVGNYFGFRQMLYENVGHKYTYKVVLECTILVLRRELVIPLLDFFPASRNIIYNHEEEEEETEGEKPRRDTGDSFALVSDYYNPESNFDI